MLAQKTRRQVYPYFTELQTKKAWLNSQAFFVMIYLLVAFTLQIILKY